MKNKPVTYVDLLTTWSLTDFPVFVYFVLQQINTRGLSGNQILEMTQHRTATGLQPSRNYLCFLLAGSGTGCGQKSFASSSSQTARRQERVEGGFSILPCSQEQAPSTQQNGTWLVASVEERGCRRTSPCAHGLGQSTKQGHFVKELYKILAHARPHAFAALTHTANLCPVAWKRSCWGRRTEPTCGCVIGRMRKRSKSDGQGKEVAMHAELGVSLAG